MDEKKPWLEKVLDDATAEVKSWPNWLRDRGVEKQEDKQNVRGARASAGASNQKEKRQSFD
jgi:hypothetical protein